ncbi:MAG TPA: type II secretion system major pseudopilin GspG [Pseudomonadales bacterium]|nr:type II secretion system major pseudopilin GspG [Pseudomonadales bacterium]
MKTGIIHQAKHSGAFTLVEVVMVMAFVGIVAAVVIPRYSGPSTRARVFAAKTDITGGIKTAIDRYKADMGAYPETLQALLMAPGKNAVHWHGPYFESAALPKDPWGNIYLYSYPGKHNPASYDLWSTGADNESGTSDDIGNWHTP